MQTPLVFIPSRSDSRHAAFRPRVAFYLAILNVLYTPLEMIIGKNNKYVFGNALLFPTRN